MNTQAITDRFERWISHELIAMSSWLIQRSNRSVMAWVFMRGAPAQGVKRRSGEQKRLA